MPLCIKDQKRPQTRAENNKLAPKYISYISIYGSPPPGWPIVLKKTREIEQFQK